LSLRWAKRRHPGKSTKWILSKYYKRIKEANHRFSGIELQKDGTPKVVTLLLMAYTPIRRHVKILQPAHPYDAHYDEYFEKRTSDKWKNNSHRLYIERHVGSFQKGKCPCCEEELKMNQNWQISLKRKASKGGEYKMANIDVIHNKCYDQWQKKYYLHK
jgi:RNA-directed DNA polymerase